jgi:putative oxygen-independent coproporphyrinogen III oxidase
MNLPLPIFPLSIAGSPHSDQGKPAESPTERLARYMRPGTLSLRALPPLSLYVHLPWCLKKCPYCDFNSHALAKDGQAAMFNRYLEAVCTDLEQALPWVWGRRVHSVFIGGGTPSLFEPAAIERLLADVRARLPLEPGCEITLEANPGTFERERFRAYRAAGVTRLSVGVQSFDDDKLKILGRVHDAAQARAAVSEAAEVFDTFNIDLMFALPDQSLAQCAADLEAALSFAPPHLSIYHLTMEPNTWFAAHPPKGLPDEDLGAEMLDAIVARAGRGGLQRYEVSAFSRDVQHRCQHNLNYWQFGDYLGLGAGAHSKLSFPTRIVRQVRWRDPVTYMNKALAGGALSNDEEVSRAALPFEFMLNALRLPGPCELARFTERTGLPLSSIEKPLAKAVARGWMTRDDYSVQTTALGFDWLNDVQALFLPD